uniref:Transposase Tc1-like domain-containing protein n=1 Tax=Oncorhynchus tshawytscha TaxID=74940 RepID=A0A8C8K613_ONCTS
EAFRAPKKVQQALGQSPKVDSAEWQQAGVSASARTVRRRLLDEGLVARRAAKKPLVSRKNIMDRLIFCKRYRDWTNYSEDIKTIK